MSQICPACKRPLTKLTKEEVQEIYKMSKMSYSLGEIAKEAGVSRQTIWMIKHKKLYAAWTDELD